MKFKTQLSIVNLLLLGFLCVISIVMYRATNTLIDNAGWVTHTSEVIGKAHALVKAMVDMETGQRGFMLTGKERFLEPYYSGELAFEKTLKITMDLVSDNPPQGKRLQSIQQLKEHWVKSVGEYEIGLKRKILLGQQSEESLANVLAGKTIDGRSQPKAKQNGKQIMDEIRQMVDTFIMLEKSLMTKRVQESSATGDQAKNTALFGAIFSIFLGGGGTLYMRKKLMSQLGAEPSALSAMSQELAAGKLTARIELSETGTVSKDNVAKTLNHMAETLEETIEKLKKQTWQETSRSQLHEQMRGEQHINELSTRIITHLCKQVSAEMGAIYCVVESNTLTLTASYAMTLNSQAATRIALGEGLVGQAAQDQRTIVITEVPDNYFPISSSLGQAIPRSVLVLPFSTGKGLVGVLELCSLRLFSDEYISYIESVAESIAVTLYASQNQSQVETLLRQANQETDRLQTQREELATSSIGHRE